MNVAVCAVRGVEEASHTRTHQIDNCLMHGDKFAFVFAFDFQVNLPVPFINNKKSESPKSIMVKLLFSILFYFSI